jgi:RNA polymerase sigma-70 factor (ECF subfamily)
MDLLAPDVVLLSDGGGKRQAALRPLHGPEKVARWLIGILRKQTAADVHFDVELTAANGHPAVLLYGNGELDSIGTLIAEDGLITRIYLLRNPDKLAALPAQR